MTDATVSVPQHAPVLSTPVESILELRPDQALPLRSSLPDTAFDIRYEIKRTVEEIRQHKWRRVALQFPDHMLVDSTRVYDRLKIELARPIPSSVTSTHSDDKPILQEQRCQSTDSESVRLMILGDTSYGACCVDEIAAEHMDAEGLVHYGRSCLSPTQRLPVIYVFTTEPLDHDAVLQAVQKVLPIQEESPNTLCLLADTPWQHHIPELEREAQTIGYTILPTNVVHNPSAWIPNRMTASTSATEAEVYNKVTVLHIGTPPTALALTLKSRVKDLYVFDPQNKTSTASLESTASALLRRRYAALIKVSRAAVVGILVNTLSVNKYMEVLKAVQGDIAQAGKKSYTFVVGKLNPAKLANFAEVEGWVVISCWESSLIDSKEFLVPVITPFELKVALASDQTRTWSGYWSSDFNTVLDQLKTTSISPDSSHDAQVITECKHDQESEFDGGRLGEQTSEPSEEDEDEPPEFDLRTGRLISHARPTRSLRRTNETSPLAEMTPSTALVHRGNGDLAIINGVASPGAEYLRTKREWQGLGSDFQIEYDRDEQGNIQGAAIEEGRSGVARGYNHSRFTSST